MSTPITQHFTIDEFRCHSGEAYPPEWINARLRPLCDVLERLRAELGGRAITILSGYRSPAHNEALRTSDGSGTGVAKNSQHVQGRAVDITVDGMAPSDVHRAILHLFESGAIEVGGVARYDGWVHVDIRPRIDGHLCQWSGVKVGDELA